MNETRRAGKVTVPEDRGFDILGLPADGGHPDDTDLVADNVALSKLGTTWQTMTPSEQWSAIWPKENTAPVVAHRHGGQ